VGITVGILYRFDMGGFRSLELPRSISRLYSLFVADSPKFYTTIGTNIQRRPPAQQAPPAPSPVQRRVNPRPAPPPILYEPRGTPSEANIVYLTNMGFPREQATMALALNGDQIDLALNSLLGTN